MNNFKLFLFDRKPVDIPRSSTRMFSTQGEKCLRTLMQYHVVPNRTLYSDDLYSRNGKAHVLFSGHGSGNGGGACFGSGVGSAEKDSG